MLITLSDLLMDRIAPADLTPEQAHNAETLLHRVNALLQGYKGPIHVNSGYRRPTDNAAAGGATKSWHLQCAAIDLQDTDGRLWSYCMNNLKLCEDLGLWLEDKKATPTWVHLQIYAPKSGRRIFKP